jgi:hypothetical protein
VSIDVLHFAKVNNFGKKNPQLHFQKKLLRARCISGCSIKTEQDTVGPNVAVQCDTVGDFTRSRFSQNLYLLRSQEIQNSQSKKPLKTKMASHRCGKISIPNLKGILSTGFDECGPSAQRSVWATYSQNKFILFGMFRSYYG